MPHIKVNLRVRAFKRVVPVFGKKTPPPVKTGDVKTKVAVGRNATVPLLGVLFEIVDLCQDRVHDAQILCPPETKQPPPPID